MVKTLQFQDLKVPTPGFGAMGLSFGLGSNLSLEQAEPVLLKAIELGCTFWDTAVVYQAGVNEKLLGDFIRKHNVRDKVFSRRFPPCPICKTLTICFSCFKMRLQLHKRRRQTHEFRLPHQGVHRRHH
jgi:predicted aldo/keto reductase-like oxidoreductase